MAPLLHHVTSPCCFSNPECTNQTLARKRAYSTPLDPTNETELKVRNNLLCHLMSKCEGTPDRLTPGNKWSLTPIRKSPSLEHPGLNHNPGHTCMLSGQRWMDKAGLMCRNNLFRVLWQPLVDIMNNYCFFSETQKKLYLTECFHTVWCFVVG